jgi:protein-L-isoaspartate(D-aspartate) O-methyltransferase
VINNMEIERQNMVRNQIRPIGVDDNNVIGAMLEIPRHKFISQKFSSVAYSDAELPILEDNNRKLIARPEMLAKLLAAAEITRDDVVLEIGCGTGYATAIISKIARQVVGIDSCKKSIDKANELAEDLNMKNVVFNYQDLKEEFNISDFSIIIVNGAALTREAVDISNVCDPKDFFSFDSRDLINNLVRNFNKKIICVEGYYKYSPMHVVVYQEGVRNQLDEIYLPEIML